MLKSGIYDFVICRGGTDMCFVLGFGRKRPDLKQYRISGLTYCQLLFNKLHGRYKFPDPYNNTHLRGNKVNKWALRKMSKALSCWKTRVKKAIMGENKKSWEELREKEPMIDEATYNLFKARCESEAAKAASANGKAMRSKLIGNHRLGAGGYRSSKSKWD